MDPVAVLKKILKKSTVVLVALTVATGCTGRKPEEQKAPEIPPKREPLADKDTDRSRDQDKSAAVEEASAVIAISEDEVKKAAPKESLNLKDLQYKVTYQDTVIGPEPLEFKNGKAVITLTELPANQIGDLKLEILSDDKTKISAVVSDVILPAEKVSTVDVDLAPTKDDTGGTTVTGGAGAGPNTATNTSTSTSTGTSTGSGTGTSTTTGNSTATGTGVSTSQWDGKSDKGNKQWTIVPL